MKAKITNQTTAATSQLGFGYYDSFGREIGMMTCVWEVDVYLARRWADSLKAAKKKAAA